MRYYLIVLSLLLTLIIGCGGESTEISVKSIDEVSITDDQIDIVSNSNNDFSFDIYRHIEEDGRNHFLSSYSLFSMFNMLLDGANGDTKKEMLKAGNINIPLENWTLYFTKLNNKIIKFLDNNNSGFKFSFANSFWVQEGLNIEQGYIKKLEQSYGVNIQMIDFENDSEIARTTINQWTSLMTDDHIREILAENTVNENSKIIMVNAMYLKALWTKTFFHNDTEEKPFLLENGSSIYTPMMHQINKFRYVKKDGIQAVCMRYKDSDFGLVSFLPPVGKFQEFESNMSNQILDYFASDFKWKKLDLYYPKYEINSKSINLKEMLIEKGMVSAFDESADFSGIDSDRNLQLSQIVQKIYFKIDEEGTEAASSTAVSIGETSAEEATLVKFDHPFIVMICHIPTRTVLFMGRVLNPLD